MASNSTEEEAQKHFDDARICFMNKEWLEEDHFLTKAIALNPRVSIYYSNRAACNVIRREWMLVEEDCRKAIELDATNVRAYLHLGRTLIHYERLAEAVQVLEKGLDLSIRQKLLEDKVRKELFSARFQLWESESESRLSELHILREACYTALKEKDGANSKNLISLQAVFADAFEAYTPKEVPKFLCCPITYDVLCDPVILPDGITYERKSIQKAGKLNPISHKPLNPEDLVRNLAIKDAAEDFLKINGWANKNSVLI